MQGLPKPPDDVIEFTAYGVTGRGLWQCRWWILVPGVDVATYDELEQLHRVWVFGLLPFITGVSGSDTQLGTCRSRSYGPAGYVVLEPVGSNHGAWDNTHAAFVSAAVTWITDERYRGGHPVTYLPGFPASFTDDAISLNSTGYQIVQTAARDFLQYVNASHFGSLTSSTLGTLHRSRAGVPLPASVFAPFFGVRTVLGISHQDRRSLTGTRFRF